LSRDLYDGAVGRPAVETVVLGTAMNRE